MALPETLPALVARLQQPGDQAAWREFLELYEPFLRGFFRNRGLQDADAGDLTQQVLMSVARRVGDWKPDGREASFRRWLVTIARHAVIKFLLRGDRAPQVIGGTDFLDWLNQAPPPSSDDEHRAADEYRQEVFQWALRQIHGEFQPSTWEAFWQTSIENEPIERYARSSGMSPGAIYMARSRVMARLRTKVGEFDADQED